MKKNYIYLQITKYPYPFNVFAFLQFYWVFNFKYAQNIFFLSMLHVLPSFIANNI